MPYDNMPFKNKQAAKSDRNTPPSNSGSKFEKLKSTMERKLSEVDDKVGGSFHGGQERRSIRGTFEKAMRDADPKQYEAYNKLKTSGKTTFETLNKYGEVKERVDPDKGRNRGTGAFLKGM